MIINYFSDLAELEAHVKATNSTYSERTASNSPHVSNLTKSNSFANVAVLADPPLDISSFLWGFYVANTVMWGAVYAVWVQAIDKQGFIKGLFDSLDITSSSGLRKG